MKRFFLLLSGCLSIAALQAQIKQGTIIYERKTDMHRMIQDDQMRAMIPQFRSSKHMLLFSDSVSVYKAVPEDEAPDPFAGGGGVRMVFRGGGSDGGDLYKNFAQAKSVQANELAGKNYLIVDTIKQQPWKLGTETQTILGHTCHKATRKLTQAGGGMMRTISMNGNGSQRADSSRPQTKEVDVVAWYADDIISPVGPDSHGQLPGVILQLDIDNGGTVFTATEIKPTVDQKELKEPKKGKLVTRQEYMKIQSDLMSSQLQGMPGGVRFRMN
ncbi:MAG: GLPGLI family protein [Chitinophagaceae bacterium]|nr:GLPGLI family protein [Chitinophagaceae bacterium]